MPNGEHQADWRRCRTVAVRNPSSTRTGPVKTFQKRQRIQRCHPPGPEPPTCRVIPRIPPAQDPHRHKRSRPSREPIPTRVHAPKQGADHRPDRHRCHNRPPGHRIPQCKRHCATLSPRITQVLDLHRFEYHTADHGDPRGPHGGNHFSGPVPDSKFERPGIVHPERRRNDAVAHPTVPVTPSEIILHPGQRHEEGAFRPRGAEAIRHE